MNRLRHAVLLLILACGGLVAMSSTASAGVDHYCEGNYVPPGWACAGGNAHTGTNYVEVTLDHTGCAGVAVGYGGWNSSPAWGSNTFSVACTNGSGTNGGCVGNAAYHGSVNNLNSTTYDYVYGAHMSYGSDSPCPGFAAQASSSVATSDPSLVALAEGYPALNLNSASKVLEDAKGSVFLASAADGQLCLVEKPRKDPHGVISRFSCRDSAVAGVEGVVAGVPGDWYVLPATTNRLTVRTARNMASTVTPGVGNVVRLPDDVAAVTVNGTTSELPTS